MTTPLFAQLIGHLNQHWPNLIGEAKPEWGAYNPESRQQIRQSMLEQLPGLSAGERKALLDLDSVPSLENLSVSISHTRDIGGWLAVPRPLQVGWDVEQKGRIKMSIIERVCEPNELTEVVDPVYLWSAKEAFFKALEDFQPVAITQLSISDWKNLSSGLWSFQGLGPHNAYGLLLDSGTHTMAACVAG